jgi:hypothetical protein
VHVCSRHGKLGGGKKGRWAGGKKACLPDHLGFSSLWTG